jgi:heme-degrading monooxygenase HmoA
VIISVLPFDLKPGKVVEFANIFDENQILEKAIQVQGCRQLMITQSSLNRDQLFVVGIWDDQDSYQRWMDHPERGGGAEELLALVQGGFEPADPAQLWDVLRSLDESDKLSDCQ